MNSTKTLKVFDFESQQIRQTTDGKISVFDLIGIVGSQTNPRKDWERLLFRYPSLASKVARYQFEGKGQRLTPVVDRETALEIIGLIEGSLKLPNEKDLEDWFVTQHEVQSRQLTLPSGKRVDVVLKNGIPCELKRGQADKFALAQLRAYMKEMKVNKGWLVANSFHADVVKGVQVLKGSESLEIELVSPGDFSSFPSASPHSSSEYREQAARLMIALMESPADLAMEAIDRVSDADELEKVFCQASKKYTQNYHPLFEEIQARTNGDIETCARVRKMNSEYGQFSTLQDVQVSALRKVDAHSKQEVYAVAKEVAQDFEDFLNKYR